MEDERLLCPNPKCNGELKFIDRWDTTHDEGECVKCGKKYHLISKEEYDEMGDKINTFEPKLIKLQQEKKQALKQRKGFKDELNKIHKTARSIRHCQDQLKWISFMDYLSNNR